MKTQRLNRLFFILIITFTGLPLAFADIFEGLAPRFSGTSQALHATAFGAGVYVAVGEAGTLLASSDSVTWSQRASGTTNRLNGVKYGSNGFVAVGDAATILTSLDGLTWHPCVSPASNSLAAVTYGAGRYVSVGSSGMLVTSTNGVNWSSLNTGAPYNFNGVDYVQDINHIFVLVGDSGTIMTSTDGLAWTLRFSGTFSRLHAVSLTQSLNWENFSMVAVGDSGTVETSSDGVNWTVVSAGTTANLLAVANDAIMSHAPATALPHFGIVGQSGVFLTGNGSTWSSPASGTPANLNGILYTRGSFLAVGDSGSVAAGLPWLPQDPQTAQPLSAVTFCGGSLFAVGGSVSNSLILQSANGRDWSVVHQGSEVGLGGVIYGAKGYLAVGTAGAVLTSSNGSNWSTQRISASGTSFSGAVAYGNGVYVTAATIYPNEPYTQGGPVAYCSTDGINWSGALPLHHAVNGITFANHIFVAVGGGAVDTSADGTNWTTQVYFGTTLNTVGFWNGLFVAGGTGVFTSSDGTNWNSINSSLELTSLAYGNLGYVALDASGLLNDWSASADGTNWNTSGFDGPVSGVAFGNGAYVAVGNGISQLLATNAQALPFLSGQMVSQGFQLSVLSQPNYSYHIQSSTNLAAPTNWWNISSYTSTQAVTTFTDSVPMGRPQTYYRVVSP